MAASVACGRSFEARRYAASLRMTVELLAPPFISIKF
jgi:hypothetical protein